MFKIKRILLKWEIDLACPIHLLYSSIKDRIVSLGKENRWD